MEKKIHLKGRLLAISEYVENSELTADIGCDHGRLCISLLQSGRAKRAYAGDISEPSLRKARLLCDKCGLQDRMTIEVSDGLCGLTEQPDTIIIAGMGGLLISEILEKGRDKAHAASHLILQPMRGIAELRRYMHLCGYSIIREKLCEEAGRIYQIMDVRYCATDGGTIPYNTYDVGEYMLKAHDPLLPDYIHRLKCELEQALHGMRSAGTDTSGIMKRLDALEKISEVYENEA